MNDRFHKIIAVFFLVTFWVTTFVSAGVIDDQVEGRNKPASFGNAMTSTVITMLWLATIFHTGLCVPILIFKAPSDFDSRGKLCLIIMATDMFLFGVSCKQADLGNYGSSCAFLSAMGIILTFCSIVWCTVLLIASDILIIECGASIRTKGGGGSGVSSSNSSGNSGSSGSSGKSKTNTSSQASSPAHSPVATSEPDTMHQSHKDGDVESGQQG